MLFFLQKNRLIKRLTNKWYIELPVGANLTNTGCKACVSGEILSTFVMI